MTCPARHVLAAMLALTAACERWRADPPEVPEHHPVDFPRARAARVAGVPLVRIPAPVGTAAVGVSLRLGVASDPADRPGLTALALAGLRGHGERPGGLAVALGEFGGVADLVIGREGALLTTEVPAQHAPAAVLALLAALRRPLADPEELATIAGELASARARASDDPGALALAALRRVAYPAGHPYRASQLSARTWSIEQVREHQARALGPAALAIVVAGEADEHALARAVEAGLAGWSTTAAPPVAPSTAAGPRRAIHIVARPGLAQAVVALGGATPGDDELAAQVADLLVQSALYDRLRGELASTYSVEVARERARGPGLLHLRTQVEPPAVGPTITAIHEILAALGRRPAHPAVVGRVCALGRLEPMFARQTNAGLLLAAAHLHWLARPPDHDEQLAARDCDRLAPAVDRALRAGFDPARLQIVVVGDPAAIEPQLAGLGLGPVVRLDPAAL